MSEDLDPISELDPENSVWEGLQNDSLHEVGVAGHER